MDRIIYLPQDTYAIVLSLLSEQCAKVYCDANGTSNKILDYHYLYMHIDVILIHSEEIKQMLTACYICIERLFPPLAVYIDAHCVL